MTQKILIIGLIIIAGYYLYKQTSMPSDLSTKNEHEVEPEIEGEEMPYYGHRGSRG